MDLLAGDNAGGRLGMRPQVEPLRALMLLAAVVLLIGCANIANLLIARTAARTPEIGTRLALGSNRWRIIRQMLVESALLSAIGGGLGVAFGYWTHRVLVVYMFGDIVPGGLAFALDRRLLVFALCISVGATLLCGLAPALRAARVDLVQVLKGDTTISRLGFGRVLVVAQVAACVLLLVSATLLVRTLANLKTRDRGFNAENLLLVGVGVPGNPYTGDRVATFYQDLLSRTNAVPGVASAGLGANALFGSGLWNKSLWVQGRPRGEEQSAMFNVVAPGFIAATGMSLLAGRDFSIHDRLGTPKVALVNEAFARRYCQDGRPVGCRFGDRGPESSGTYAVIGVVKNARYLTLREAAQPMIYEALMQEGRVSAVTLHVRTTGDAAAVASRVRAELHAMDPALTIRNAGTMARLIDESLRRDRMMATFSGYGGPGLLPAGSTRGGPRAAGRPSPRLRLPLPLDHRPQCLEPLDE